MCQKTGSSGRSKCCARLRIRWCRGDDREYELSVRETIRKVLMWITTAVVVILAILLPVIIVTGMFGGKPWAGTVALIGLGLLAFGVAWYVRTRDEGNRG